MLLFVTTYVAICLAVFGVLTIVPIPAGVHHHDIVSRVDAMNLPAPEAILIWPLWNLVPVVIATAVMLNVERRQWTYVFGGNGLPRRLIQGLLAGLASVTLLVSALLITRTLAVDRVAVGDPAIWSWGARWAIAYIAIAAYEEFTTRGFALKTLTRGVSFTAALAITSLWFMSLHVHNDGETLFGLI